MPKVFSYERVSSLHQAVTGRGLERQSTAAEKWCQARGLELDTSLDLSDPGRSAFHGDNIKEGALGRFLALAQAGELGKNPILLVEAIDRISRLELIDAVQDVIFGLLRSGVVIQTLEDGQEYTAAAVNTDIGKAIQLMAKVHASADYSKRLSRRIEASWDQTIEDLQQGKLTRSGVFLPKWCEVKEGRVHLLEEKCQVVRQVFDLALTEGDFAIATQLNEEGVPTLGGQPKWTKSHIRLLLTDPRVWGAVRLNRQDNMSAKRRTRRGERAAVERLFPDVLPLVLTKDQVDKTLAARNARSHPDNKKGRRGTCHNIAGGMTFCSCGAAASLTTTNSGSRKDKHGQPLKLRYLKCAAKCGASGYRLESVNSHLLLRLKVGQLQKLLASDERRVAQIKLEQKAIESLQAQLDKAEQAEVNAGRVFKDALKSGVVDPLFKEAVEEARLETTLAKTALTGAQQRLSNLRHDVDSEVFNEKLQELYDAFRNNEDTPEQRSAINRLLKLAGTRVVLHAEKKRVGLSAGNTEVDWMELRPNLDIAALEAYLIDRQELPLDLSGWKEELFRLRDQQKSNVVDVSQYFRRVKPELFEGLDKPHMLLDVRDLDREEEDEDPAA